MELLDGWTSQVVSPGKGSSYGSSRTTNAVHSPSTTARIVRRAASYSFAANLRSNIVYLTDWVGHSESLATEDTNGRRAHSAIEEWRCVTSSAVITNDPRRRTFLNRNAVDFVQDDRFTSAAKKVNDWLHYQSMNRLSHCMMLVYIMYQKTTCVLLMRFATHFQPWTSARRQDLRESQLTCSRLQLELWHPL